MVVELELKEQEEKKRERKAKERHNREAFRLMLQEHVQANTLNHKTKWKEYLNRIKSDHRLLDMLAQPGSTVRELYEDAIA